jgi:adenosylcobinamide-GDP ribazoletransferase
MHKTRRLRPRLRHIGVALALLTRLPLPRLPDAAFANQAGAGWAWPLAGLAVATLATAAGTLALSAGLPATAVAGIVLAVQVAATGAMHEDGLADTADGLWGGLTPQRRLEIMRDSHIGSYGVLALILALGLRWTALAGLIAAGTWIGPLLGTAILSRALLPGLMTVLPPARPGGLSGSLGVPGRAVSLAALGLGAGLALACAGMTIVVPALAAGLAVAGLAGLARARIGGQTGDILGAAQQVAETVLLLGLLAAIAG